MVQGTHRPTAPAPPSLPALTRPHQLLERLRSLEQRASAPSTACMRQMRMLHVPMAAATLLQRCSGDSTADARAAPPVQAPVQVRPLWLSACKIAWVSMVGYQGLAAGRSPAQCQMAAALSLTAVCNAARQHSSTPGAACPPPPDVQRGRARILSDARASVAGRAGVCGQSRPRTTCLVVCMPPHMWDWHTARALLWDLGAALRSGPSAAWLCHAKALGSDGHRMRVYTDARAGRNAGMHHAKTQRGHSEIGRAGHIHRGLRTPAHHPSPCLKAAWALERGQVSARHPVGRA